VLTAYSKALDQIEKVIGAIIVTLLFFSFVVVFAQVIVRYVFAAGFPWIEESARFMVIWLSFLGSAIAIRNRKHLYIDVLEANLPYKPRMILNVISELVLISFFIIMMVVGYQYSVANRSNFAAGMGISMFYVYISLVVGMVLCTLYSIELLWKRITTGEIHPGSAAGKPAKASKTNK